MPNSSSHSNGSSVVSIWGYNNNKSDQEKFIGSAFFISSSLLLTARHVVKDKKSDKPFLFDHLFLRLVDGQDKVTLDLNRIYCHPELDIALIFLSIPYRSQSLCTLSLQREDHLVTKVNCFGIHKDNHNRDANLDYTVGTYNDKYFGYLIDHQVKKGFSGGPVATADTHVVIGIFSQRNKGNQETLFIPLFLHDCKNWLKEINAKINDPKLHEYLNTDQNLESHYKTVKFSQFAKELDDLVIFIERPESAYKHVIDNFDNDGITIKLCLCLYSSNQDVPLDFARALALKLNAKKSGKYEQKLLGYFDRNQYNVDPLSEDVLWNSVTYQEFSKNCLIAMIAKLSNTTSLSTDNLKKESLNELKQRLIELLKNRPDSRVFMIRSTIQKQGGLFSFLSKNNPKKQLKERFEWINKFNEYLKNSQTPEKLPWVTLLFFVKVEKTLSKNIEKCFSLKEIESREEVFAWLNFSISLLKGKWSLSSGETSTLHAKYENQLFKQSPTFPLSYQQLLEQVETRKKS